MPAEVTALKRGSTEDGAPYLTKEITLRGVHYKFRELTVEENDDCADASRDAEGVFNPRTMMRMVLMKAAQDPKITATDLGHMSQPVYLALCEVVNQLLEPAEPDTPLGK